MSCASIAAASFHADLRYLWRYLCFLCRKNVRLVQKNTISRLLGSGHQGCLIHNHKLDHDSMISSLIFQVFLYPPNWSIPGCFPGHEADVLSWHEGLRVWLLTVQSLWTVPPVWEKLMDVIPAGISGGVFAWETKWRKRQRQEKNWKTNSGGNANLCWPQWKSLEVEINSGWESWWFIDCL